MDIEVPSDPAGLAGLRRRLRTWLELRGLAEDERDDAILAVSEACNNAIEHAYRASRAASTCCSSTARARSRSASRTAAPGTRRRRASSAAAASR